jgi:selenocysteine-specific translation elongation factor
MKGNGGKAGRRRGPQYARNAGGRARFLLSPRWVGRYIAGNASRKRDLRGGDKMFIAVISDNMEKRKEICRALGKETGMDDLGFYSVNYGGKIRTIIEPALYPEKVQPLIYSIYAADLVVVAVDALGKYVGEMVVALDALKKENGILISSVELPVKGTVLEKYKKFASFEEAKQAILDAEAEESGEEELFALVDKAFSVKSVGNVALGLVREGKMKKHDKLLFFPGKKEVEVKSIQLNDKDAE